MEVENPLFVEESRLPSDHAIHFHVMCSSEGARSTQNCGVHFFAPEEGSPPGSDFPGGTFTPLPPGRQTPWDLPCWTCRPNGRPLG